MATVAPYGTWQSPISAEALADGAHTVVGGAFVGDEVWWLELRPAEGGRYAVRRLVDGEARDVLPAPWNPRSRVHEYGGGAWTVTADGVLAFVHFPDQRVYRLVPGEEPSPLTPAPPQPAAWRYGALAVLRDGEVWCVRERHGTDGSITRDIAAVPLDGSAADDEAAIRSVAAGSHFLASPRLSPSGRRLAWIAWEHPQMPWDGTQLRIADLDECGVAGPHRTLLGSTTESVLQPEWVDDDTLYAVSDRSGFWNLYLIGVDGLEAQPVAPVDADIGGPLWLLDRAFYRQLADGRLLTVRTFGLDTLAILDPTTGSYTDFDLGDISSIALGPVAQDQALLVAGGPHTAPGLRQLDLRNGSLSDIRLSFDAVPDPGYLPSAEQLTFPSVDGREVHAIVYRPRNADFVAPEDELPPFVAFVHGGPRNHVAPMLSLAIAYYTSRGIGLIDVNYGGSTGYGREYRNRLRGQWGVIDVEDTVAAVQGLADAGIADRARFGIEGGSAGGWTVLRALTGSDAFACGVSRFGVADLLRLAADTHDFESRDLDQLVGPLPEAREVYEQRAPVNNIAGLSCPVLLLQGLDDPIVPPSQAERFRDALVEKGIPHAYRPYKGESHGFRKRETIVDDRQSCLSFYGQVFGFEPPGVPKLELWRP